MLVDWVSRGKYAIGIAGKRESVTQFVQAGAPIGIAIQKEGHGVTPSAGCVAMPSAVAHPNASVVFLNWLLTKEGQTLFSKSFGLPSTRADVTREDINPLFLARPGEKIFPASEKETVLASKMQAVAKKVLEKIQR